MTNEFNFGEFGFEEGLPFLRVKALRMKGDDSSIEHKEYTEHWINIGTIGLFASAIWHHKEKLLDPMGGPRKLTPLHGHVMISHAGGQAIFARGEVGDLIRILRFLNRIQYRPYLRSAKEELGQLPQETD